MLYWATVNFWGHSSFHLAFAEHPHSSVDVYKQIPGLTATHSLSACRGEKAQVGREQ